MGEASRRRISQLFNATVYCSLLAWLRRQLGFGCCWDDVVNVRISQQAWHNPSADRHWCNTTRLAHARTPHRTLIEVPNDQVL
jgi:hypothetical protein